MREITGLVRAVKAYCLNRRPDVLTMSYDKFHRFITELPPQWRFVKAGDDSLHCQLYGWIIRPTE